MNPVINVWQQFYRRLDQLGVSLGLAFGIWMFNEICVLLMRNLILDMYVGTRFTPLMGSPNWVPVPIIMIGCLLAEAMFSWKSNKVRTARNRLLFRCLNSLSFLRGFAFHAGWWMQTIVDIKGVVK